MVDFISRLFGVVPMRVTFWCSESYFYNQFNYINNNKKRKILSGASAGIIQTIVENPIEVIKTQKY